MNLIKLSGFGGYVEFKIVAVGVERGCALSRPERKLLGPVHHAKTIKRRENVRPTRDNAISLNESGF